VTSASAASCCASIENNRCGLNSRFIPVFSFRHLLLGRSEQQINLNYHWDYFAGLCSGLESEQASLARAS